MNIRDLRPGNLIRWVQTNEIVTVTGVFEDKKEVTARKADGTNVEDIIDAFEGVVFNKWDLERWGFEATDSEPTYICMSLKNVGLEIMPEIEEKFYFVPGELTEEKIYVDFIHELQNLYYWLSNKEELDIKQPL